MKKILLLLFISFSSFGQDKDSLDFENPKLELKKRFEIGLTLTTKLSTSNDSNAVFYLNKLEKMAYNSKSKELIAKYHYIKGSHEVNFENFATSLPHLQKAENIFLSINKKHDFLPSVYRSIGQFYLKTDKFQQSINYLEKSIKILPSKNLSDTMQLMKSYYTIGTNYTSLKEKKKSLDNYRIAYNMASKTGNEYVIAVTSSGLSISLSDIGKDGNKEYLQEAILMAKKSNTLFKKLNIESSISWGYLTLGSCYYALGDLKTSIENYKNSIQLCEKFKINSALPEGYEGISQSYKDLGDYKNAYFYLEKYKTLKNELTKAERTKKIDELSTKYETEKKEAQIKDLSQQKQISELESTRKTTLIYSILGGILALSTIAYFSFTRFRAKKENELLSNQLQEAERRIEIEQKATESELKALKSQMNPHFMFNALNSIQEQFMYGDKVKANEQMGNFTYLTRQILTVSGKKKINLSTEIEILTKYLELEKMRFAEGFDYTINLSETIDEDYHQIPPMLIQPFVENSIKHGLLHKQGDKKLSISFDLDEAEENLICVVEDNGVGREKSAEIKSKRVQQHESFSTSATEERLRLLNNNLQNQNLIVYEDLTNDDNQVIGTKVTLTIALG